MSTRGSRMTTAGSTKALPGELPEVYDPENPSVGTELHKANGLLVRALELADTLLTRVRGPACAAEGDKDKPAAGLLTDACTNREFAAALCASLDELARLMG